MSTNWVVLDSDFPTFSGEESPEEMIGSILNYLYMMKEQLQYSLNNLTADNWNATALKDLTEEQQSDITQWMQRASGQVTTLSGTVEQLAARVTALNDLSSKVSELEEKVQKMEQLEQTVAGLTAIIAAAVEGTTVGKTGIPLYLVGEVYINGTLQSSG